MESEHIRKGYLAPSDVMTMTVLLAKRGEKLAFRVTFREGGRTDMTELRLQDVMGDGSNPFRSVATAMLRALENKHRDWHPQPQSLEDIHDGTKEGDRDGPHPSG